MQYKFDVTMHAYVLLKAIVFTFQSDSSLLRPTLLAHDVLFYFFFFIP